MVPSAHKESLPASSIDASWLQPGLINMDTPEILRAGMAELPGVSPLKAPPQLVSGQMIPVSSKVNRLYDRIFLEDSSAGNCTLP